MTCEITLAAGQTATFVLERVSDDYVPRSYSEAETREAFDGTIEYWRRWLAKSRYQGRWREMVHRSALTLKLLTFRPTGGIVAAPTTSLPEQLGGARNWDYRYTWIRDAAFSLYALPAAALHRRGGRLHGLAARPLQGGAAGERGAPPDHVRHRRRARTSKEELSPPRRLPEVGTSADRQRRGDQLQLDIYGELLDSVYFYTRHGSPIDHDAWVDLSSVINWICENWYQADGSRRRAPRRAPRRPARRSRQPGRGRSAPRAGSPSAGRCPRPSASR